MDPVGQLPSVPEVGGRIPAHTIHAVSVSLPSVQDVIGYEEKRSETMSRIKSGYPRFVAHPYVTEIISYFQKKSKADQPCVLVSSAKAAMELFSWSGYSGQDSLMEEDGMVAFPLPADSDLASHLLSFIQHTGCLVSSRRAEDFLYSRGMLSSRQPEDRIDRWQASPDAKNTPDSQDSRSSGDVPGSAQSGGSRSQQVIRQKLADLNSISTDFVALSVSGMNAMYAGFRSLQMLQENEGRDIWLQLGWLYVDNIRIIEKFTRGSHHIYEMHSVQSVETFLQEHRGQVAGIITEVPTNPLLQTPDLNRLYDLCREEGCALIADISVGSSVCVDVVRHCDLTIESLTKFASGSCDVMMGAAMINPESPFAWELKRNLSKFLEEPYEGDLDRMAFRIANYEERMAAICSNLRTLSEGWRKMRGVRKLIRPDDGPCGENYERLAKVDAVGALPGGLVTMELNLPMENVYDALPILKGPSFGTDFTLIMLYLYLAHYELVSTEKGVEMLRSLGMEPDLLRISVGLEDPQLILQAFDKAFALSR